MTVHRLRNGVFLLAATLVFASPFFAVGLWNLLQAYLSDAHAGFLVKAYLAHDRGRLEIVGFSYPPLPLGLLFLYPFLAAPIAWGAAALGALAVGSFSSWVQRGRVWLGAALLLLIYAPAGHRLVVEDFSQALGLALLWIGWRQYLIWIQEGITAYGFFAGLLFGAAVYTTPVALPFAVLAALSVGPVRRLDVPAWLAAATVLAFPVLAGAWIWAYLAWTFLGNSVFLYEVFRYTPYAPPSPLALLFPLAVWFLVPKARLLLLPLLLTLPASRLLHFGFSQDFAFYFLSLLSLETLLLGEKNSRLFVWSVRGLFLIAALTFLLGWAFAPPWFHAAESARVERAIGETFKNAPPESILTDDRTTYRYLAWTGSAKPFLLPADAGYTMALSAPERFVRYIFACPGNSELYRRIERRRPPSFSPVWRHKGCLFLKREDAPPLF